MDAQQFLAEFGHIANAPGGVARLRELVLQLAISGRLVIRDGNETPIEESIEKASEQRRQYERDHELRPTHTRKLTRTNPYSIPEHWQWEPLENLALYIQRGKSPKYAESGKVRVVSQKCVQWAGFDITSARYIADDSLPAYGNERFLCGGDLLWNSTGTGTVGRVAICQAQQETYCVADSHVTVVRPSDTVLSRYLWCVIASPWVQTRFQPTHPDSLVSGTTQQVEFSTSSARAVPIPVPPLEEQTRIVAKVDELMQLCDKLEDEQQKRRKLQNTLRQATLQAVAKAQSPHELQASWARLEANFGRLFSAPEDVAELRGLILDMAMRGYLVHQDKTEESAMTLCDHVEQQKRELSKIKKLKLHKSLSPIGEDEVPFIVPKGWKWIRLGQVVELINGDRSKSYPNKDEYVSLGVPWINTGHIEPDGTLTRHHMNFISREKFESLSSGKIEPGDLVYCLRGATFGKTAFVTPYEEGAIASSLVIIRPINASLSRYLYYYLISPLGRSQIYRFDNGTAQPNLSANSVGLFAYPLPPLNEQIRITDKIEQLMRTCDSLEMQIRDSCEVAARLATATIASLTGIAIEQEEDEPVKVPQIELISKLRLGQAPSVKAQAPLASLLARQNGELSAQDLWQRYGGEIDAFYAQLKIEVAHGWIEEPAVAEVREKTPEAV